MIAAGVVMIFAAIALAGQHVWLERRRDSDVAATVDAQQALRDEEVGRWRESYEDVYDQLLRSQDNEAQAVADNVRLSGDLHWARLSIAVMQAEGDLLGELLGAGARSNVVPLRREGGR